MKVLLFDLGQTLIENVSIDLVNGFISLFGDKLSTSELQAELMHLITQFKERSHRELLIIDAINEIMERRNLDLGENIENRFLNAVEVDKAIDGVGEVLNDLKQQGFYLGVISNTIFSGQAMKQRLFDLGYPDVFSFVLTSADATYRKPYQEIFQKALSIIQQYLPDAKMEDVYFVGDSYEIDVLGCMNAGMKPIWLNVKDEKQNYAGLEIKNLSELKELADKNMIK